MQQILMVGSYENAEQLLIKAKKGSKVASGQVAQENILRGLEDVTGRAIDTINGSIVPPYPQYADRLVPEFRWESENGAKHISVSYLNIKYLNRLTCRRAMCKASELWARQRYLGGDLIVLVYGLRSPTLAAACQIKKLISNAKIYLLVTDLPKYMDMGESRVKAFLKKIDWIGISSMLSQVQGYILYAAPMAEYLHLKKEQWILMEGSFNGKRISRPCEQTDEKVHAIMYSGRLDEQYGIPLLLDAFMQVKDESAELWLTGSGNSEEYIRQCAQNDHRIKMLGFLSSRADVLQRQQKAFALVNMRLPSQPSSAYCFPSKLFEYMATGKPVLSFRIKGIPEEYFEHLLTIESETVHAVKKAIEQVFSMSEEERNNIGTSAADFVFNDKNRNEQAKKICRFIGISTME